MVVEPARKDPGEWDQLTLAMTTRSFNLELDATASPNFLYSGVRCLQWPHLLKRCPLWALSKVVAASLLTSSKPHSKKERHRDVCDSQHPQLEVSRPMLESSGSCAMAADLPRSVELHERMLATVDVLFKGRGCCRTARVLMYGLLRYVLIRVISGYVYQTGALKEPKTQQKCTLPSLAIYSRPLHGCMLWCTRTGS